MKKAFKWGAATLAALTLAVACFAGGAVYGRLMANAVGIQKSASLNAATNEVLSIMKAQAYQPVGETSITAGAIEGMLTSLDDPYAAYYNAKDFKYLQEQNSGEFYGIGIVVTAKDKVPTVVSVMDGTPAQKAGLKAGDQIVSVGSVAKDAWDLDEVVSLIRGPEGTKVKLGIVRGKEKPFSVEVTRAKIETPNVSSKMLADSVGYVRLFSFNERSGSDVSKAIASLEKKGAKGYILDLRDNPGGLLTAAVDVSSLFIKDGVVVTVKQRSGSPEVYRASGKTATDKPVVVLINGNSASASEIVSGALQDYDRAKLVGVKSYGKGSVQQIDQLSFGGAVKLTIAHYFTPKDRSINKVGLTPDVIVKMDAAKQADAATDVQLKKAAKVLSAQFK